ncbi:TauD/TfdA dioxygenase family protein [Ottowia thiooxydans]|uniref:Alpha-ketoglutarate-dependent taurine dioxygenase n=1 Tax=Ottowia thiooxydans TaxID=219182 RepID=A0ABV2Q1X7_9BURK
MTLHPAAERQGPASDALSALIPRSVDVRMMRRDTVDLATTLRRLLMDHDLVILRDAPLDDEQLGLVGGMLGEGCSEIKRFVVEGPTGSSGQGRWHHVGNLYDGRPCELTLMSIREFPSHGGEFELVSNRRAWSELTPEVQHRLRALEVEHDFTSVRHTTAHPDDPSRKGTLPLVRDASPSHLLLGYHAAQVVGMERETSDVLLSELMRHATRPENVYRHAWQPNDVIAWHNLPLMHRTCGFEVAGRRVIHEVQVRVFDAQI